LLIRFTAGKTGTDVAPVIAVMRLDFPIDGAFHFDSELRQVDFSMVLPLF
jgi:hypothetical protein